jgi:glucan 1,3-beta-glucosidase
MRWSSALFPALLVAGASAVPHSKKSTPSSSVAVSSSAAIVAGAAATVADPTYWLADITHQGLAPYAASGYSVFRNVKDYGAAGEPCQMTINWTAGQLLNLFEKYRRWYYR